MSEQQKATRAKRSKRTRVFFHVVGRPHADVKAEIDASLDRMEACAQYKSVAPTDEAEAEWAKAHSEWAARAWIIALMLASHENKRGFAA